MAVGVYKGHHQGDLTLNAVTIGVESNAQDDLGISANDYPINHEITLSIRVHTAWATDAHDQTTTVEIMDNLITKLRQNANLGNYKLMRFEAANYRASFLESQTRGGEVRVVYHTIQNYQQE